MRHSGHRFIVMLALALAVARCASTESGTGSGPDAGSADSGDDASQLDAAPEDAARDSGRHDAAPEDAARDSGRRDAGRRDSAPDSPSDAPTESGGCAGGQVPVYDRPGCDGTVEPVCGGPSFDGCAAAACGCDGTYFWHCGSWSRPWTNDTTVCDPTGATVCESTNGGPETCAPFAGACDGGFGCSCVARPGCFCWQLSPTRLQVECSAP